MQRIKITHESMVVLGAWGAGNLAYSGISINNARGSDKYFHRMNIIWGGVNFTVGTLGYLLTKKLDGLSYSQSLKKQMTVEKIFLLNTGLDIAYIAGGFYLNEKSNSSTANPGRYRGFGKSIILQGSALFLFDGICYLIHQRHGKKLYEKINNVQMSVTENGFGCLVKF